MTRHEKITEILNRIENGVNEVYTSETWKKYIKTMSRFHHYSISNSLLIYLQKPDATYVAGYNAWKAKFQRNVKSGEKAIRILAPFKKIIQDENDEETMITGFRAASVFDISQTEGKPLPKYMCDQLEGSVKDYKTFLDRLFLASPVKIIVHTINGNANGFYNPRGKIIEIRDDLSEIMTIKTCIHEIAHALLHTNQKDLSKQVKETEAESVAYGVCSYYGIDTGNYSFPYIAGWSSSHSIKESKESMHRIRDAIDQIIETMECLTDKTREIQF